MTIRDRCKRIRRAVSTSSNRASLFIRGVRRPARELQLQSGEQSGSQLSFITRAVPDNVYSQPQPQTTASLVEESHQVRRRTGACSEPTSSHLAVPERTSTTSSETVMPHDAHERTEMRIWELLQPIPRPAALSEQAGPSELRISSVTAVSSSPVMKNDLTAQPPIVSARNTLATAILCFAAILAMLFLMIVHASFFAQPQFLCLTW
ncbi:hypothetical protein EKO04_008083 [Ascochyta lentis]|uniref:Uncharacterized protein n=1 Tax=Ascochyta lentis TaxID=205686 RepID=A0A8H7J0G9_9PLEO|nr:hypothetical protein EKO04_008083 [Ascochyta lentis]